MNELKYLQVCNDNPQHYDLLLPLQHDFIRDLDANRGVYTADSEIELDLSRRVGIQGSRSDMHFEVAFLGDTAIGFTNYAIALDTTYGLIDRGGGVFLGYYIAAQYRRKGYARQMFEHCERVLISEGAKYLHTCPEPNIGEPFWTAVGLKNSGIIEPDDKLPIYIKTLPGNTEISAKPMLNGHIDLVISIVTSANNKAALHLSDRSAEDWRKIFANNPADPDEANFIICMGNFPAAWLKIYGMQNAKGDNTATISMLAVREDYQHKGIGSFAVRYAEDYVRQHGFNTLIIHTTDDNTAALNFYKKLGYHIQKQGDHIADDGTKRRGYTLYGDL